MAAKEKPELTITEFARLGGHARADALTAKRRKEIATNAIKARWANAKKKGGKKNA